LQNMELLVQEHGRVIFGLCRKLTPNYQDAEDLYQQTFLTALGKEIRREENPRAFLAKICVSLWKNELRKRSRRSRIAPLSDTEPGDHPGICDLSADAEEREQLAVLRACVSRLEERQRLPVLLYYAMELPLTEIAGILHIPEGTVKSRLAAARRKLREEMEGCGYDG